ncbi:malonyl-CoA decarboxylase domain-containing protein [Roseovarius aestuariivivens]|uniref:malonyl-CoA decarboxylase domain-containing protein n=1 Tax=Roseovarius aestuariivivens TaxID=1888910 RepID=UPI0010806C44|nr:malonyl-CoA decarboxylase family protein [Roseovarius aestuariivivens]
MTILADLLSTVFDRRHRSLPDSDTAKRPIEDMALDLVGEKGELSGLQLAGQILSSFMARDDGGKLAFLTHIATQLNLDPESVRSTLDAYEAQPSRASYRAFMTASEPRRQELIRRLNSYPGATGALVRMRADLLRLGHGTPELEALDLDFRHLLSSWFNRGFLVLRPISWESPAHILEKIIAYEAVHAIDSWDDLRRRLEPRDRRCFAFFHPAMPDEPLIFVEVALTQGVPGSIQKLLSDANETLPEEKADTAVFYSISNCQSGLAGISFGNSLIKQVAADLSAELPGLKTFVTLSPIPGLVTWAETAGVEMPASDPDAMQALAAHYLVNVRRSDGAPLDPVARFHLGNGAILHAVHAEADTSPKGRTQSGGTMVNYLYDLERVAQNHEAFVTDRTVAACDPVRKLAQSAKLPTE